MTRLSSQYPVHEHIKKLAQALLPILLGGVLVLLLGFFLMPQVAAVPPAAPLVWPADPVTNPPRNTHVAPANTAVSITYDNEAINAATVSTRTFAVHAMQTGLLTETYGVSGGTISLTPPRAFKPGELVQASATTRTLNLSGQGPATPTVWQFWAAVTGGSGVFTDSGQRLGNSDSRDLVLGDVDGDGDLDAVVANSGSGQANQVWLNDGSGGFTDSGRSLGISNTYAVALGDLDGDGDLDAFVANRGEASQVWLNDGRGVFTDSGQRLDKAFSQAVALGDVDGDGDLDAFVANVGPNQVWLNNDTGAFTDSGQRLGNADSRDVALGDLDGDGDLDAFFANQGTSEVCNEVWRNNGGGVFTDSHQCLGNADGWAVALGDVDSDSDLDAFVANDGADEVWLNDGSGGFTDSRRLSDNSDSRDVALGDVDRDGDLDAFVANAGPDEVWLNDGTGVFTDGQRLGDNSDSWAVALGDLKPNGALDAFVANHGEASTVWWAVLHPAISLNKTVGTEADDCAITDAIGVTPTARVVYCYRVTNVGDVALTAHTLTHVLFGGWHRCYPSPKSRFRFSGVASGCTGSFWAILN